MKKRSISAMAAVAVVAGCHSERPAEPPSSSAAAVPPASSAAAQPPGAPVPLFNGKDLTGWVQILDSKWTVENGVLSARQDPSGRRDGESWLITEKDYTDFVLTLKFKVTAGGNSGVFMRDPIPRASRLAAADGGQGPWEAGLEANIQADNPEWPTGSIYSIGKCAVGLEKVGEWNDFKARVQGDHVWTWINGQPAADTAQTRTKKGGIGFQRHGTPKYKDKLVEMKDIYIQEL